MSTFTKRLSQDSVSGETKAGVYTTEFWTTLLGTVYMVLNATGVLTYINPRVSSIAGAALIGAYTVGRSHAKKR